MNIQIFSCKKCFDSKKAERWFKERRIKIQLIDVAQKGFSPRELESVVRVCGLDELVNEKSVDYDLYKYLAGTDAKFYKLLENPDLIRTPVVRNGSKATVGYRPDVWEKWCFE